MFKKSGLFDRSALVLILVVEIWIFSGSFQKYFNHDSLFYLIHAPKSWTNFEKQLTAPDAGQQYRHLTLGVMGLIVPHIGVNPRPYHWMPLTFHLLNTCLFYILLRRLMPESLGVLAAVAFWGLHSVAGWITYDITCISDFMLAFLYLLALILAVEAISRNSYLWMAASVLPYALALLTKESATTFPLALWITLGLAEVRASQEKMTARSCCQALKKAIPLVSIFSALALAHAALLLHWFRNGVLYTQGSTSAYDINLWSNLVGKLKYLFWALNLPDALHTAHAYRDRFVVFVLMGAILLAWLATIVQRRGKISWAECGGILWFLGLNIPALLLSHRLAKWYLYEPLFGLAIAFGFAVPHMRPWFSRLRERFAGSAILTILAVPILVSSSIQTRSYLISSNAAFASDTLQIFVEQIRRTFPVMPHTATLYILPSYDRRILDLIQLLSVPPIDQGQLFELLYPGSNAHIFFAQKADHRRHMDVRLPGARALYYLDGQFFDVTRHLGRDGKAFLFVLPTSEGKIPPIFQGEPIGGIALHNSYVQFLFADKGLRLPENYYEKPELWILQYLNGHFTDVTDYYKGRRREPSKRLISSVDSVRTVVSRHEIYPDYERFGTPSGKPAFFPEPSQDIFTQIGGSTVFLPEQVIPSGVCLRFDISWMHDLGDGAWAELRIRTRNGESTLYREYLPPNTKGQGLRWKEVSLDLQQYANQRAELVLMCYNDAGKTTVADWLNWRGMSFENLEGNTGATPSLP